MRALAGDVGGTNARLAAVEVASGRARVLHTRQYPSGDYGGLGEIVRRFVGEAGMTFDWGTPDIGARTIVGVTVAGRK